MIAKYRHLSDQELVRLVHYKHGDLVDELCARLERRYTPAARYDENHSHKPDYREYPPTLAT